MDARQLLGEALRLSNEERAALAGELIQSLDAEVDADAGRRVVCGNSSTPRSSRGWDHDDFVVGRAKPYPSSSAASLRAEQVSR